MRKLQHDHALLILGQNIRNIRRARGISQDDLGGLANLHRTYICDVERGARNVSIGSLISLARALGTTVSELTKGLEQSGRSALRSKY
jgi:transcriptional regulator with XRE-family HTH domain